MIFDYLPINQCEGAILAHSVSGKGWALKKGAILSQDDIDLLTQESIESIYVAQLEDGDVHEDAAAAEIGEQLVGAGLYCSRAFTGRCNIQAEGPGVVRIRADFIDRFNKIDESVTIATLRDFDRTSSDQVVATVKIIPFAVSRAVMDDVRGVLASARDAVSIVPFEDLSVTLINTTLPHLKSSVIEKTTELTRRRVESLGGRIERVLSTGHTHEGAVETLREALASTSDLILIVGASVTVDRNDAIPAAIQSIGGEIVHFGMPVDPGNMVLIAKHNETPIVILPGCARSPKLNGIDWILQRYAARIDVRREDVMAMGVGGLLVDNPVRPLPRDKAVRDPSLVNSKSKIAALVLAAGQSRRMGSVNKLLQPVNGKPLVRHTVEAVINADVSYRVVVTGFHREDVEQALEGLDVELVHNPNFAGGLSTTLRAGLAALPEDCDAVVVCLADMPNVDSAHIDAMTNKYQPSKGHEIIVPVYKGKRGNPVLWGRQFWPSMESISGDVGARHLIGQYEDLVYEVEFDDTAVLTDLDTPEQWSEFRSNIQDD